MTNTITGKIEYIGRTEQLTTKDGTKTFLKRELVLDVTRFDPYTGERGFENFNSFEFSGDKCAELDRYKAGDVVTVSFDLSGSRYDKDGVTKYFTRIRGYKIELRGAHAPAPAQPAQQQAYAPAPQPAQQQAYAPAPQAQPQQQPTAIPQQQQASQQQGAVDDLPF